MTEKDIQTRYIRLISFYSFCVSILISIYLTNIQGLRFLYVFLLLLLILIRAIWIDIIKYSVSFFIIIWLLSGFFISYQNSANISLKASEIWNITWWYKNKVKITWKILSFEGYDSRWSSEYFISIKELSWDKFSWINLMMLSEWSEIFKVWDILSFESKIYIIKDFSWFQYSKMMFSKGIYWKTFLWQSYKKLWNEATKIDSTIEIVRNKILSVIKEIFPGDSSSLLSWMLIWDISWMSEELKNSFSRTWLTHIVAVSWFNITIIIAFLSFLLRWYNTVFKTVFILFSILFFVLIVWNNIPAYRAAASGSIAFLTLGFWRQINTYSIFTLILVIFALLNPLSINYDISLQLTFLAVLGIMGAWKELNKRFSWLPEKLWVRESLTMTISALIFTLPITTFAFDSISFISPISNILIAPAIPFVMLFWLISVIMSFIWNYIWIIFWFIAWLWLKYIISITEILSLFEYSSIKTNLWIFEWFFMINYFIIMITIVILLRKTK